ncbi:hypothetical protein Leryth_017939 [Lithospermum erythrorhizon]|nr:hypothetical protein Leryth_017939 [Lithospermum erythrorhizon]
MEMKKVAFTILIAAASISAAVAANGSPVSAPAPAPTSDAITALPAVGSLVGATILSFFAICMH